MTETLPLTLDELLTTTRAVRRRLDFNRAVPRSVILECVDIAQQAPVGSNFQRWHFVVVEDAPKKEAIAKLYRQAYAGYRASPIYATAQPTGDIRHDIAQTRVAGSADY
jgi:nitroreductase